MKDLIVYFFAGIAVLAFVGFVVTYVGAFVGVGIQSKFKWWHWILLATALAFFLFVPTAMDCSSWWNC